MSAACSQCNCDRFVHRGLDTGADAVCKCGHTLLQHFDPEEGA